MKEAVPFKAPESMTVTMDLPYGGKIQGMGIPKGVTLIVGGGYHGKSRCSKRWNGASIIISAVMEESMSLLTIRL